MLWRKVFTRLEKWDILETNNVSQTAMCKSSRNFDGLERLSNGFQRRQDQMCPLCGVGNLRNCSAEVVVVWGHTGCLFIDRCLRKKVCNVCHSYIFSSSDQKTTPVGVVQARRKITPLAETRGVKRKNAKRENIGGHNGVIKKNILVFFFEKSFDLVFSGCNLNGVVHSSSAVIFFLRKNYLSGESWKTRFWSLILPHSSLCCRFPKW